MSEKMTLFPEDSKERFRVLPLLTNQQVCDLFKREALCIRLWRMKRGLPYVKIPGDGRDNIRYDRQEVIQWAKRYGVRLHLQNDGIERKILHVNGERKVMP